MLANLFGDQRSNTIRDLHLEQIEEREQDQVLLDLVVLAVAGYFFLRKPSAVGVEVVKRLGHPLQVVRMDNVMTTVIGWCRKNRPDLEAWITPQRFETLANAVITSANESGPEAWHEQTAFIVSEQGAEYHRELLERARRAISSS